MLSLRHLKALSTLLLVRTGCAIAVACALIADAGAQASAPKGDASVVARGEYLARAGDCVACHTLPAGKVFGGGRPMDTPFGTLYTPNISSDKETGIGKWTAAEFYSMMHTGKSRDGSLLYPAMPFGSYTKVTRADSDAIYAYLMSTTRCISRTVRTNCASRSTSASC